MTSSLHAKLLLVLGTSLAPVSLGDVTYISQDRSIKAQWCGAPPKTISAPDFKTFDAGIDMCQPFPLPCYYAKAAQTSLLGPNAIWAFGTGEGAKQNGCSGHGWSNFHVVFEVTEPTAWALDGSLYINCQDSVSIKFTGPGVSVSYELDMHWGPETLPFDESGVLQPGQYELTATAYGHGQPAMVCPGGTATFSFELRFDDHCLPDCDASGSLSIDDFICFQTLFALGDPAADCDEDGELLIDDFICFQTAFAVGCG